VTALPNKHYIGRRNATEVDAIKEHVEKNLEKETWTAGFWYSWRKMEVGHKTGLDGDKWSVDCSTG